MNSRVDGVTGGAIPHANTDLGQPIVRYEDPAEAERRLFDDLYREADIVYNQTLAVFINKCTKLGVLINPNANTDVFQRTFFQPMLAKKIEPPDQR